MHVQFTNNYKIKVKIYKLIHLKCRYKTFSTSIKKLKIQTYKNRKNYKNIKYRYYLVRALQTVDNIVYNDYYDLGLYNYKL